MQNEVKKGDFVKISYTARLEDGTIIDSTDEKVARESGVFEERARYGDIIVVVGDGHVIKGLDEALEGKEVGFKGEVEVPPEKAFGEYDPENKEIVTLTKFKERPSIGQKVQVGEKYGYVERIIGRRVIVDFNHPYAGKKIIFDFEIKEKIEDPLEKVKALILLYTAKEVEAKIEDGKVIVDVPRGASFDQFFLIGKFSAINSIFKHFEEIKEVDFIERYPKPEPPASETENAEPVSGDEPDTETDTEADSRPSDEPEDEGKEKQEPSEDATEAETKK
jgi:FKBP-type peptidyl-prolyl cis-trans isomerase SlyD